MEGAEGAEQIERLIAGGYSDEAIQSFISEQAYRLHAGGFSQEQISAYFGRPPIDEAPMRELARGMIEANRPDVEVQPKTAEGMAEAYHAGFQQSVRGLMQREKLPDLYLSEDPSLAEHIASAIGMIWGDAPAIASGAAITGLGTSGIMALPGGFGAPMAMRKMLMEKYEKGEVRSVREFWERFGVVMLEEFKGLTLGLSVAGAGYYGGLTGAMLKARYAALPGATPAITATASEIAALTTVGHGLEGEIPSWKDFVVTSAVIVPIKAAVKTPFAIKDTAGRLRTIYARTGRKPADVVRDSEVDPSIIDDLHSSNQEVPRAYRAEDAQPAAKPEAQPIPAEAQRATGPIPEQARALLGIEEGTPTRALVIGRRTVSAKRGESPDQTLVRMRRAMEEDAGEVSARVAEGVREVMGKVSSVIDRGATREATIRALREATDEDVQAIGERISNEARQLVEQHVENNQGGPITVEQLAETTKELSRRIYIELGALAEEKVEGVVQTIDISGNEQVISFARRVVEDTVRMEEHAQASRLVEEARAESARSGRAPQEELERLLNARFAPPAGPRRSDDEALNAVLDRISIGGKGPRQTLGDYLFDFRKNWIDQLHPLKEVVDAMAEGRDLEIVENAYELARLHVGVSSKGNHFLEYSPFEFGTFERVGRPLKEVLRPIQDDVEAFRGYLVSKRAIELAEREKPIETGLDLQEARSVVVNYGGKFEPVRLELLEYQTHVLRYLKDSGLIGDEAFEAMQRENLSYVPLYRHMERSGGLGASRGLRTKQPIMRIKGGEQEIVDPLESIIKNTYLFITLAERNEIAGALVKLAETSDRGAEFATKVKRKARPIKLTEQEITKWLEENEGGIFTEMADPPTIFRADSITPSRSQIAYFRNGVREVWDVDPKIAEVFNGLDASQARILTRFLTAPTRLLRAGAVLAPEFMLRNPLRDQFSAYIFSEAGYKPMTDWARGIVHLARKSELYQEWLRSGGPQSELVALDRLYLQKGTRQILEQTRVFGSIFNVLKSPIEALAIMSQAAEQGTRIGEFARARGVRGWSKARIEQEMRARGATKEEIMRGGFLSREVSLDFGRIGAKARVMNSITAFFNAQVQGASKTIRAFVDHPTRSFTRVIGSITIPSILLRVLNEDEEGFHELNPMIRDLTWPFALYWGGKVHWFCIPKPFELGLIFGTGAERIVDYILKRDRDAFKDLARVLFEGATPALIPTATVPLIEIFANQSLFWNRPLIPRQKMNWLPEYQSYPYTTELTKAIGRGIATLPGMKRNVLASPAIIDSLVSNWSGGLGRHILRLGDKGLREAGILPDPPRPEWTMADMPFIKAFALRYPSASAESIQRFYENYAEQRQYLTTIRGLASEGEAEFALRELKLYGPRFVDLEREYQALSAMKKTVYYVWKSPFLSPEEQQASIERLYLAMIAIAQDGNKKFDMARRMEAKRDN